MSTPVLICDDSSFARKQMSRALPEGWDIELSFAKNGVEGIAALCEGKGDILFLDLNMPEMDGYQVLQAIRKQDLPTMVIVVSGDVQPEAYKRVMSLGALDFIKKPVDAETIKDILNKYGVVDITAAPPRQATDVAVEIRDGQQEVANVAMGRAGDLLARVLGSFVELSIPSVNALDARELHMAISQIAENEHVSAVCQGFIGSGIAGECLLIFNESSFEDIARLVHFEGDIDDSVELELLMDISSVLIGAYLKGLADQLDVSFSQGHPMVLGRHLRIADLLKNNRGNKQNSLAIETAYRIGDTNINCDLLMVFTGDSVDVLNSRIECLLDL